MNKEFKKEIKKVIEENYSDVIDDGKNDKEHVEKLYDQTLASIPSSAKKANKKHKNIIKRVAIITACVIVLFVSSVYLSNIPQAQAFRFNLESAFQKIFNNGQDIADDGTLTKYYSNFDELDSEVAGQLPQFNWLPAGFELQKIQITDIDQNTFVATLDYSDQSDGYIGVSIAPFSEDAGAGYLNDSKFQIVEINGMKVGISIDQPYVAEFFSQGSYLVSINTSVDKDSLIKIIQNIK
jgi:hypothetical protein